MKTFRLAVIILLMIILQPGCIAATYAPPIPHPAGARARYLLEKQFRLAVLDFGEGPLADALPAMLLTELRKENRFIVYEGGAIRVSAASENAPAVSERTAWEHVDGYVSGTITSQGASQVCFDVRLENAFNHQVLFAASTCTGYSTAGGGMILQRDAIHRLAESMAESIKRVGHARVIAVDDQIIFIDMGRESGLLPGMVALLVATGESLSDASLHASVKEYTGIDPGSTLLASTPVVVGELRIVVVEDKYIVALLERGSYALVGDTVFFK